MVNTSALESRGRGFKSRSRQFLEFHLCSFISFFHWFQFICVMCIYIYIYIYTIRSNLSNTDTERTERSVRIPIRIKEVTMITSLL